MLSMRGFEMKVKKKNIIWLCANVAVFALFVFFFRVKFVAAAGGRLFRGEHRLFDLRPVQRTYRKPVVCADGAP